MAAAGSIAGSPGQVSIEPRGERLLAVRLTGAWHLQHGLPSAAPLELALASARQPISVVVTADGLKGWDSSILTFLLRLMDRCREHRAQVDLSALPQGIQRMIEIAEAVPEKIDATQGHKRHNFVERVGLSALDLLHNCNQLLGFFGEVAMSFGRLATGRARWRKIDLLLEIQECGARALGIVTLISYLVGVILAFMGAIQLQQFGAAIYVADLVGIAMVREMGAMMTAIIMAGRTGAAFAAQVGTMKVTQEIDALTTLGVSPVDFLVLPRIIALVAMMPLLCLYADAVGILGGATIGVTVLHTNLLSYLKETQGALTITQLWGGLLKALVYGALVAIAGCLRGFECGNSSSAVGEAATRAVVTSIVLVVCACGIFAVIFNMLGI